MTTLAFDSEHEPDRLPQTTDLRITRRLLDYVFAHPRLFAFASLLYPITAAAVILPPYLLREILDHTIPTRDISGLYLFGALYLVAIFFEYVSGVGSQFAMGVLGQRAVRSLRHELFAHVNKLPARFFDRNPVGRVLTRLTNDVEALTEVFATGAITIIGDLLVLTAVVAMMLWLDVRLTLFSVLVVPPLVALTVVFRIYARRAFRAVRTHLARINTYLNEHIAGMSVVQIFGQQERTAREFAQHNEAYRDANRSAILFDAMLYAIVEAIGTAAVAAIVWFGASGIELVGITGSHAATAGTLVAFVQLIRRFFIPIRDLSTKYTVLQSGFAAAERIFTLRDEPILISSPKNARPVLSLGSGLALDDVWFSYADGPREADWVLRRLNIRVAPGEKVALVGPTGSGKTTILKLLNRTYDVQRGAVRVDGTDVRQLNLAELRRLFAVVLQDVHLFTGTVLDNLAIGEGDLERVQKAARSVQAHSFIERLPGGYDTPVRELGTNFSAGERQLLAFARALARDPEVLILDEATSSVDSETEARIQTALDILLRDRTAIIVAHRLSTIRKVDRILVLQRGRVVEEGDHATLLNKGGFYSQLAELQFGA